MITDTRPPNSPEHPAIIPCLCGDPVYDVAVATFNKMAPERKAHGIEKYGVSLRTFDGRDTQQDALEELFDGWMYTVKAVMENKKLAAYIQFLEAQVTSLDHANKELQDASDRSVQKTSDQRDDIIGENRRLKKRMARLGHENGELRQMLNQKYPLQFGPSHHHNSAMGTWHLIPARSLPIDDAYFQVIADAVEGQEPHRGRVDAVKQAYDALLVAMEKRGRND